MENRISRKIEIIGRIDWVMEACACADSFVTNRNVFIPAFNYIYIVSFQN